MKIDYFRYLFKRLNGFYLMKNVVFFRKPLELWNEKTGESVKFKKLDDALDYTVDNKTVREIIEASESLYVPPINGGRGAGSGGAKGTFKFGHASGGGGSGEDKSLPPALANVKIKEKSLDGALAEFKRLHRDSDHEWGYEVDAQGYVHQYVEGQTSSVGIWSTAKVAKGQQTMIIHNHPSGGAFSDNDLISVSMNGRSKGIIASGSKHDYKFEKGGHFKADKFIKAVKSAKMTGTDYDDAVHQWLTKNQKKYGYKYTRTKN